jgi:SAM-dependent methyltransferase
VSDRVAAGFDRLSPFWDLGVRLFPGAALPSSRARHLALTRGRRRALIVGGGTGEFLGALLADGFGGEVVLLDVSPRMLGRARRRIVHEHPAAVPRVAFVRGDVRDELPEGPFDLICTHFVLDLFEGADLRRLIRRLATRLSDDGVWLCSDFAPAAGRGMPRSAHRLLLRSLYLAFGLVCAVPLRDLPPIEDAFDRLGFETIVRAESSAGLFWSAGFRRGVNPSSAGPARCVRGTGRRTPVVLAAAGPARFCVRPGAATRGGEPSQSGTKR